MRWVEPGRAIFLQPSDGTLCIWHPHNRHHLPVLGIVEIGAPKAKQGVIDAE